MMPQVFDAAAIRGQAAAILIPFLSLVVRIGAQWLIAPRLGRRGWWPEPYDPPVWWWKLRLALAARLRRAQPAGRSAMRIRAIAPPGERW